MKEGKVFGIAAMIFLGSNDRASEGKFFAVG